MIDVDGAYGVLGYGPKSVLWNGLTDPTTDSSGYTIDLGAQT
jgi:hypothetical protein